MENEFDQKYYQYMDTYNGITGIFKKASNYRKIDYRKVYALINQYKNSMDFVNKNVQLDETNGSSNEKEMDAAHKSIEELERLKEEIITYQNQTEEIQNESVIEDPQNKTRK